MTYEKSKSGLLTRRQTLRGAGGAGEFEIHPAKRAHGLEFEAVEAAGTGFEGNGPVANGRKRSGAYSHMRAPTMKTLAAG